MSISNIEKNVQRDLSGRAARRAPRAEKLDEYWLSTLYMLCAYVLCRNYRTGWRGANLFIFLCLGPLLTVSAFLKFMRASGLVSSGIWLIQHYGNFQVFHLRNKVDRRLS